MSNRRLGLVGRVVLALLAVFAIGSGIVATAAQAAPSPRWTVNNAVLPANQTRELTAKADGNLELAVPALGGKIVCSETKLKSGAVLIGSEEGLPGKGEFSSEFSNCTTSGLGTGCHVVEPIVTNPVIAELVENEALTTFLVEFLPKETNFATLQFKASEGGGCTIKEAPIKGQALASIYTDPILTGKEAELVSTSNTDLLTSWLLKFEPPTKICLWKGLNEPGVVTTSGLTFAGKEATLTGSVLILLKETGGTFGPELK